MQDVLSSKVYAYCNFLLPISTILAAIHKRFWFMLMRVAWRVETCAHIYTRTHTQTNISQQAAPTLYQKKLLYQVCEITFGFSADILMGQKINCMDI